MIVLLAAVVVAAALFFGLTAVMGAVSQRGSAATVILLGAGAVVAALVVAGLTLGMGLTRGGSAPDEGITAAPTTPPPSPATSPSPEATMVNRPSPPAPDRALLGPRVYLTAGAGTRAETAMGSLVPGTVLQIEARGFRPLATATARQCAGPTCGNQVSTNLDKSGQASFLFLVTDTLGATPGAGRCRINTPPCSVIIHDDSRRAVLRFLFHDAVPDPGRLRVTPARDLADGSEITIHLSGFPAGATAQVVMCATGSTSPDRACGKPGLDLPVSMGPDGTATTSATVSGGTVGADHVDCRLDGGCAIAVVSADAFVRARPVGLTFRAPPDVSYDRGRLAVGLALAALLLLVALAVVRRTDWSPRGEAAVPEIDGAEYADLDAMVAALPPDPDLDELIAAMG